MSSVKCPDHRFDSKHDSGDSTFLLRLGGHQIGFPEFAILERPAASSPLAYQRHCMDELRTDLNTDEEIRRYKGFLARLESDASAARQLLQKHETELQTSAHLLKDLTSIEQVNLAAIRK